MPIVNICDKVINFSGILLGFLLLAVTEINFNEFKVISSDLYSLLFFFMFVALLFLFSSILCSFLNIYAWGKDMAEDILLGSKYEGAYVDSLSGIVKLLDFAIGFLLIGTLAVMLIIIILVFKSLFLVSLFFILILIFSFCAIFYTANS